MASIRSRRPNLTAILGLSAFYHDSAAALVVDGQIVAAAQEERFTRRKNDASFPTNAVESCLERGGLTIEELDFVGFYEKPLKHFDRLLESWLAFAPRGYRAFRQALPLWLQQKLRMPTTLRAGLHERFSRRFIFTDHHESHAASAFYPSPFESAAILTMDGVGEWTTASIGIGEGRRIRMLDEIRFPHSLGLLYSAFTSYLGFRINSGEYKVMGLAPYGRPVYRDQILKHLVQLFPDGSFRLDQSWFRYVFGLTMTSSKFHRLFDGPPRKPEAELTQRHMDIAASLQSVVNDMMCGLARRACERTGLRDLVMAGGVALNCVGNGRILENGACDRLWVQPAAGDAGGALGTALFIAHQLLDRPRVVEPTDSQRGSLLGPEFSDESIRAVLESRGVVFRRMTSEQELLTEVAGRLAQGQVVGWFQGRMEFGPRALGSRSILGDARDPTMQSRMNLRIKFRESFRPFAPIVLRERASDWFDLPPHVESPYMLLVTSVAKGRLLAVPTLDSRVRGNDGPGMASDRAVIHANAGIQNDSVNRAVIPANAGIQKDSSDRASLHDLLTTPRSQIPAVTHVDNSARVQTVDADRSPLLHQLLTEFERQTGCAVLINTSFNVRGEPVVCRPDEAISGFLNTGMDALAIGPFVLEKIQQPRELIGSEARKFDAD